MKPINKKKLEKLRKKREQDVEMLTLIKQIMIYAIYLMFLLFLAKQNRNSKAYYMNFNMKRMFVNYAAESYETVRLLYLNDKDVYDFALQCYI